MLFLSFPKFITRRRFYVINFICHNVLHSLLATARIKILQFFIHIRVFCETEHQSKLMTIYLHFLLMYLLHVLLSV